MAAWRRPPSPAPGSTGETAELSQRARRWFERHILDCDDCWREVLLGRFGRRMAEDAREPVRSGLRDRVRASILLSAD